MFCDFVCSYSLLIYYLVYSCASLLKSSNRTLIKFLFKLNMCCYISELLDIMITGAIIVFNHCEKNAILSLSNKLLTMFLSRLQNQNCLSLNCIFRIVLTYVLVHSSYSRASSIIIIIIIIIINDKHNSLTYIVQIP